MRLAPSRLGAAVLLLSACHAREPASAPVVEREPVVIPSASASASDEPAPAVDDVAPPSTRSTRTASGLRIEILRDGSGPSVEPPRRVRLHYVGMLPDGSVFDSSRQRGTPMEIEIGKGYLIKGFEQGVAGMRIGEVRRLTIPPELGYGDRGAGGKIPPNSTLVFEVELVEAL